MYAKVPTGYRWRRFVFIFTVWPVFNFYPSDLNAQVLDCNAEFVSGQVLVRFKNTATAGSQASAHAAAGGIQSLKTYTDGLQLVKVANGHEKAAVAAYKNNLAVEYAEPDYIFKLDAIPVDTEFSKLWGLSNTGQTLSGSGCAGCPDYGSPIGADVNALAAWDIWTGDQDFVVAVIDTGIDYGHPDLKDNLWINSAEDLNHNGIVDGPNRCPIPNGDFNCVDDDQNGCIDDVAGCNFTVDPGASPDGKFVDQAGHGTHVAGTIAARGNNSQGVTGVNWRTKIMTARVIVENETCSPASRILAAIQYTIDRGAKISNNSWGGYSYCQFLYDKIDEARSAGQLFIASAGNDQLDVDDNEHYPSGYDLDNIISVAATDNDDKRWRNPTGTAGSNYGLTRVHIGAPGDNVFSTWTVFNPTTLVSTHTYTFNSGTSMAAPHVTGATALLWSRVGEGNMSYSQVRGQLLRSARKVDALRGKSVTEGVVDLYRTVLWDCAGDCENPLCIGVGPDCDGDGISDACEIASGESCDSNGDFLPDECGACCSEEGECTAATSDQCSGGSTFYAGVACDMSPCFEVPCCLGDTCSEMAGTKCMALGGTVVPGVTNCSGTNGQPGSTCYTGSCCLSTGCEDRIAGVYMTLSDCNSGGGFFFGGMRCNGGVCNSGENVPPSCSSTDECSNPNPSCLTIFPHELDEQSPCRPLFCPAGTIDRLASLPPDIIDGSQQHVMVDARYPHAPNNPSAKKGLGDPNGPAVDLIQIKMVDNGAPVLWASNPKCWCLCETDEDPETGANWITQVEDRGNGLYAIHLGRPITPLGATTINYMQSAEYMTYIAHPANVNGNSQANEADIQVLIQNLNGQLNPPLLIWQCDIDHSGVCAPADILGEIDLLNGANGFAVADGTQKPNVSPCPEQSCAFGNPPCSSELELMQSIALVPAQPEFVCGNSCFVDYIVSFLTGFDGSGLLLSSDLKLIVNGFEDWCAVQLSPSERFTLAKRLAGASYASEGGYQSAMGLAAVLVE